MTEQQGSAMTEDAPIHAIVADVQLALDFPYQSKTLTITLRNMYTGSAAPPSRDYPSFASMRIPDEFRVALLNWLTEP